MGMANDEHVDLINRGVDQWNAERPDDADLRSASLNGMNLRGADLQHANLTHAELRGACLSHAVLEHALFFRADLTGADLSSARLNNASLERTCLVGANFSHAWFDGTDLTQAYLKGANLSCSYLARTRFARTKLADANFSGATFGETFFVDTDLSAVEGLETSKHFMASVMDFLTLQRSIGLPLSFLRGVGMPESLIEHLSSLFNQAIQFYTCFISYSARDQEFADRIHADLQDKGVRCWFAPHDLTIGSKVLDEIESAIRLRDKVLLILSEHSIKSAWVEAEVMKAIEEEGKRGQTVLFPIRIDDAVMDTAAAWAAMLRRMRKMGDFRKWHDHTAYKAAFERMLRDLTAPRVARVG
jgi:hypothetical protein